MNNGNTNASFKQQLLDKADAVLKEKTEQFYIEVSESLAALLKDLSLFTVDTHGLIMHGLDEAARATEKAAETPCIIFYNVKSKEVYIRENRDGRLPVDVDLLYPYCPYVCRTNRRMEPQEIADKVYEAVDRNVGMALIESKYLSLAQKEKNEFFQEREEVVQ